MKNKRVNHKKYKLAYIISTMLTLFVCLLFQEGFVPFEQTGENYFHVKLNGQEVGVLGDRGQASELLQEARRQIASGSTELLFMEAELDISGEEVLWGVVDNRKDVLENMKAVLKGSIVKTLHRSYTVKVKDYMANLGSLDEVTALFQAAIDKYDSEDKFRVGFEYDKSREFSVLAANVVKLGDSTKEIARDYSKGGIAEFFADLDQVDTPQEQLGFEDYDLGILTMDFQDGIEVVEAYLPEDSLTPLADAVEKLTKEQETARIYKVQSGDTLSEISINLNIPIEKIIEMNDALESEFSTLQIDQELIITVPEPELSVTRVEQCYSEEIYDAPVIYIDNDEWYTTKTVVHQQPSAGFRKVIADICYVNDKEVGREILKEEIVMEAVPKIVERGTKIPPTYIKPISGGRLTSGFGKRKAPKKGASTYHKGVDWAIPTGTAVYASCGGTVAKAGWGKGYGYVIYINHEDGRQTRYGHLSKVLVSAGQTVKQGERIALSGNTGVSTGPHLHFEILIGGSQVNPMKYLQ